MTPQLTTVYVPCDANESKDTVLGTVLGQYIKPFTGYFLTPEEMEEVKRETESLQKEVKELKEFIKTNLI